jgi:glucose/mannose transport system substrate-binding protein
VKISTRRTFGFLTLMLCTSLATACGGGGDDAPAENGDGDGDGGASGADTVEITSWWSGPGEAEALSALLEVHEERNEGVNIFNSNESDGSASELTIEQRLEAGDPPDAFQENIHDIPAILAEFPDSLEPLDDLFEENGWNAVFLPEVLDAITIDGNIYAMPVGVHRENAVFMNEAIFTEHDLAAPTSIEELMTVCEALAAEDVTCLATGGQGWIVRIMFLDIVMGTMGGAAFQEFFAGEGDPDDPLFAEAVDHLQTILDNYINQDLWVTSDCVDMNGDPIDRCLDPSFGWQEASQALFDGEAAMFMHGDWAGGYVQQLGWEAGVDYSVVGAPGASDTFLFGVDTFALPADAANKEGALAFFETIGSLEGQAAFNNIKGSTPVRLDADPESLTPVGKKALEDLNAASVVMGAPTFADMDLIIMDFANGVLTKEEFIAMFQEALYP